MMISVAPLVNAHLGAMIPKVIIPHGGPRTSLAGGHDIGRSVRMFFPSDTGFAARFNKSDRWAAPIIFGPTYPDFLHGAPPTPACAAFIKESRMKLANTSTLDRKSGVRPGERGAPVRFPSTWAKSFVS
jgi:hypothetical protein